MEDDTDMQAVLTAARSTAAAALRAELQAASAEAAARQAAAAAAFAMEQAHSQHSVDEDSDDALLSTDATVASPRETGSVIAARCRRVPDSLAAAVVTVSSSSLSDEVPRVPSSSLAGAVATISSTASVEGVQKASRRIRARNNPGGNQAAERSERLAAAASIASPVHRRRNCVSCWTPSSPAVDLERISASVASAPGSDTATPPSEHCSTPQQAIRRTQTQVATDPDTGAVIAPEQQRQSEDAIDKRDGMGSCRDSEAANREYALNRL